MDIKIEKLPKSRLKLHITASKEEISPFFEQAWQKLSQQVNIKGFRPGKAPKIMVIEAAGINRYHTTALDLALNQIYYQALVQEKINPVSQPDIAMKNFSEEILQFEAEVDVVPGIKLGKYQDVRVRNKELGKKQQVTDEEVEKVIKNLRYREAKLSEIDQPAEIGHHLEIDFEGSVKGVKQEDSQSKNHPLILGENSLLAEFEEKLIGMCKGEEKDFTIKVGERKIDFHVKINMISRVDLPELNDEYAKKFGRENLEELKKAINESLQAEKAMQHKTQLEQVILDKMLEKVVMEIPQSLVEMEIQRKIESMQKQMGILWQQFLKRNNKTVEDLRQEMQQGALKQVKTGLMLGEIAKDLGYVKTPPKTKEEQEEIIRKTMDKLVEMAT